MGARLTQHGKQRGKERMGLNIGPMTKLATRALERGYPPASFGGSFRRYLDGRAMYGGRGAAIRVYGEQVYIFSGHDLTSLVTVHLLPPKYRRLLRRLRETKPLEGQHMHEGAIEHDPHEEHEIARMEGEGGPVAGPDGDDRPIDQNDPKPDAGAGE